MIRLLLWPGTSYLIAAVVVYGGVKAFQVVSAGFTAVRTERSLHRHSNALKDLYERSVR